MHGSWGPQKNIELGLSALKRLKKEGVKFKLVISGGLNRHFPDYEEKFNDLLHFYSDVIDEYLGPVTEKDVMNIFLNANLLLLPYNAPGGLSGVLEHAIFFEVPTIAIDFPEYREQARGVTNVKLVSAENYCGAIEEIMKNLINEAELKISIKIKEAILETRQLLILHED